MSYPVALGDIIQCNIEGKLNAQVTINTFHYKVTLGSSDAGAIELLDVADIFDRAVWSGHLSGLVSNQLQSVVITVQKVFSTRYQKVVKVPVTTSGTLVEEAAPSGVSVVWRRRTDIANRHGQGRVFVAGVPKDDITASQLADDRYAAWVTALAGIQEQQMVSLTGVVYKPVLFNKAAPADSPLVNQSSVDQVLRYQRRREIGKGV